MSTVNVEELSRERLEDVVIHQSKQIRILQEQLAWVRKEKEELEEQYDELSNVVLAARRVLSC